MVGDPVDCHQDRQLGRDGEEPDCQFEGNQGARPCQTMDEREWIKARKREVRERRQANGILLKV